MEISGQDTILDLRSCRGGGESSFESEDVYTYIVVSRAMARSRLLSEKVTWPRPTLLSGWVVRYDNDPSGWSFPASAHLRLARWSGKR